MISFELSEEEKIVRSTVADFASTVLRPRARQFDSTAQINTDILNRLWELGIVQAAAERDDDRSEIVNAIILEELAVGDATAAAALGGTLGFVQAMKKYGSEQQRAQMLSAFMESSVFRPASIAIIEPGFDFRGDRFNTSATAAGDTCILNGQKSMVPLALHCSDLLVVAECEASLDAFVVPMSASGVSVSSASPTLGLRGLAMANVAFSNVAVPQTARIGGRNIGKVQNIVDAARVGLSALLTGLSRGVLDYVVPYTKDRVVFGGPLAQKQSMAFTIADMHIEIEAMRWLTWQAAWSLARGASATKNAQLAYTFACRQAMLIADKGVQALGGHGYVREHPMELWYRNARALSVLEGTVGI